MRFLDKIPDWLKISLKIIISIAALILVVVKIDFNQVISIISKSNWWLFIPAIAFFVLSKIIASLRLNIFFSDIAIILSNSKNLKLYWLGMFYNLFLPGGIGGDGYKIFLLNKKYKIGAKSIFIGVLLDRISGLIALISLSILLSIILPLKNYFYAFLILSIPLIHILYYQIVSKYFNTFVKSLMKTNLLSILVQVSQLIAVLFIVFALKIQASLWVYLFIFLISSVVATVPFTIGGVGARELTFLYAATWLDISIEAAIGISFMFFAITAIVSLFGLRYNLDKNFENQFEKNMT